MASLSVGEWQAYCSSLGLCDLEIAEKANDFQRPMNGWLATTKLASTTDKELGAQEPLLNEYLQTQVDSAAISRSTSGRMESQCFCSHWEE